ncbi:MAG: hypothetical protein QW165_00235 [Candidatus Woesearchaeota archaeon]
MVKKTVIAIVLVVLLVAVFAAASYRYGGYLPYQSYYGPKMAYPRYVSYPGFPYPTYQPPSYVYPYYVPVGAYPERYPVQTPWTFTGVVPPPKEGQLCSDGCAPGLVCDYSRTSQPNVGVCARWA